jgi:hypothetical protein
VRDFQKSRVYSWEDTLPLEQNTIAKRRCSFKRCRELINQAVKLYNLPEIEVQRPKNSRQTTAMYIEYIGGRKGDGFIVLPKNLWRVDVALHEAAHYIVASLFYRTEGSDHGAVFVRVYMHLLKNIIGADIKLMEDWAHLWGIDFSRHPAYKPRFSST